MGAVVRQGEIVEQGSHGELIQTPNGAYATLVRLQASTHTHPDLQQPIVEQLQHSADPEVLRQVISSQVHALSLMTSYVQTFWIERCRSLTSDTRFFLANGRGAGGEAISPK